MILLTGFEPFGGETSNPSMRAAAQAADILRGKGLDVEAVELPCVFDAAVSVLDGLLARLSPDLVICAGQAGGRAGISLERVAINCIDARIPDNAGRQPVDVPAISGAPAAYFTSLPIKAALIELKARGLDAHVSQSAGTYVCNQVFFGLLHALTRFPEIRGGFVHVPYSPAQAKAHGAQGMSVGDMAQALTVIVEVGMRCRKDVPVAAGTEH